MPDIILPGSAGRIEGRWSRMATEAHKGTERFEEGGQASVECPASRSGEALSENGRVIVTEMATSRDMGLWERTLDLSSVDLGNEVVVEIVSNTVNPSRLDLKQSQDNRELGVQVGAIAPHQITARRSRRP